METCRIDRDGGPGRVQHGRIQVQTVRPHHRDPVLVPLYEPEEIPAAERQEEWPVHFDKIVQANELVFARVKEEQKISGGDRHHPRHCVEWGMLLRLP